MITEPKKKPDPTDIYVGSRIRLRRNILGLSQEKLGERLGVTFQQVQKYEKGTNRVGASRLQAIAVILDVPVSYFFVSAETTNKSEGVAEPDAGFMDFCSSSEGVQLMRAFTKIADPKIRRKILDLARVLSEGSDGDAIDLD